MAVAHEHDWSLLHYRPPLDWKWIEGEWSPSVAVVGPEVDDDVIAQFAPAAVVSVTVDRSANHIASVCLDEQSIALIALEHLLATGLRTVTTFRYGDALFSVQRERAFIAEARTLGVHVAPGWGREGSGPLETGERPAAMVQWLRHLPKPCGIFTCTDSWGAAVARYAHEAGLRVPEDVALVGADNDELECELISPPLSSVVIPWQEVGRHAATLVRLALANQKISRRRIVVSPVDVATRRSSSTLAVTDPLVASAVSWIQAHADQRLTVAMVARAVGAGRQRVERRFRRALDRTVQDEIRRTHVEAAKHWLATTKLDMVEVAKRSGFTTAALLNVAFRKEIGMPPGAYRRRVGHKNDAQED